MMGTNGLAQITVFQWLAQMVVARSLFANGWRRWFCPDYCSPMIGANVLALITVRPGMAQMALPRSDQNSQCLGRVLLLIALLLDQVSVRQRLWPTLLPRPNVGLIAAASTACPKHWSPTTVATNSAQTNCWSHDTGRDQPLTGPCLCTCLAPVQARCSVEMLVIYKLQHVGHFEKM